MSEFYTRDQAITIGMREVCHREGHKLKTPFYEPDNTTYGGVQGVNAMCDKISCSRCDVVFAASYPAIDNAGGGR